MWAGRARAWRNGENNLEIEIFSMDVRCGKEDNVH